MQHVRFIGNTRNTIIETTLHLFALVVVFDNIIKSSGVKPFWRVNFSFVALTITRSKCHYELRKITCLPSCNYTNSKDKNCCTSLVYDFHISLIILFIFYFTFCSCSFQLHHTIASNLVHICPNIRSYFRCFLDMGVHSQRLQSHNGGNTAWPRYQSCSRIADRNRSYLSTAVYDIRCSRWKPHRHRGLKTAGNRFVGCHWNTMWCKSIWIIENNGNNWNFF